MSHVSYLSHVSHVCATRLGSDLGHHTYSLFTVAATRGRK